MVLNVKGEKFPKLSIHLILFQAFSDAAINKEISELRVHCVTANCNWSGVLRDYEVCIILISFLAV